MSQKERQKQKKLMDEFEELYKDHKFWEFVQQNFDMVSANSDPEDIAKFAFGNIESTINAWERHKDINLTNEFCKLCEEDDDFLDYLIKDFDVAKIECRDFREIADQGHCGIESAIAVWKDKQKENQEFDKLCKESKFIDYIRSVFVDMTQGTSLKEQVDFLFNSKKEALESWHEFNIK